MRALRIMVAVPAIGLALAATPVAHAAPAAMTAYHATLTAADEVSPGPPGGTGTATIEVDSVANQVCSTLTWSSQVGTPSAAHIHRGAPKTNGPILVTLSPTSGRHCAAADPAALAAIAADPGSYYVNIHTSAYPGGAVRGQLQAG